MTIEDKIKKLIIERYGTISNFTNQIGMPNSTFATIMKKGIHNASIQSIILLCQSLGISADELANDRIVPNEKNSISDITQILAFMQMNISTYDLTLDGYALSESEKQTVVDAMELSIEFIRRQR